MQQCLGCALNIMDTTEQDKQFLNLLTIGNLSKLIYQERNSKIIKIFNGTLKKVHETSREFL